MTKKRTFENIWNDDIAETVVNNIKIHLLRYHASDIIHYYGKKVNFVVRKYAKYLPNYVVDSEIDDLITIAKLEFLETLKVWSPNKNTEIWPLAQARIIGAMKDHIRFITKSDPSRIYDWVNDAAQMYLAVNDRADFETKIENGIELNGAMEALSYRERKIVLLHTKEDLTFKEIGQRLGVSESQISRIYKKSIERMKKVLKV